MSSQVEVLEPFAPLLQGWKGASQAVGEALPRSNVSPPPLENAGARGATNLEAVDPGRPALKGGSENYFSMFDDGPYHGHDEEPEGDYYESFEGGLDVNEIPAMRYLLVIRSAEGNPPVEVTRFEHDIIFTYDDSKILEVSGAALAAGIAASMLVMPPGFNTAVSLFLSAPLFVCAVGIFVKRMKQRAR